MNQPKNKDVCLTQKKPYNGFNTAFITGPFRVLRYVADDCVVSEDG